jgi:hypothetical protein
LSISQALPVVGGIGCSFVENVYMTGINELALAKLRQRLQTALDEHTAILDRMFDQIELLRQRKTEARLNLLVAYVADLSKASMVVGDAAASYNLSTGLYLRNIPVEGRV